MDLFADERGAVLSPCGMFRYYLWREWDASKPTMLLLMLNPSRADHRRDDHTITKSIAIARNLGFGRLDVGNLAAFRSSDPGELRHAADPVGPENDRHLRRMLSCAHTTVCAWGANATLLPGRVRNRCGADACSRREAICVEIDEWWLPKSSARTWQGLHSNNGVAYTVFNRGLETAMRRIVAVVLLAASAVANAQDVKDDSRWLVHWELTRGGVKVAQNTFDPLQHHVDEWRDIKEYTYRPGCAISGMETAVKYGEHVWINSGAVAGGIAAVDVRVEARSTPVVPLTKEWGCDVPTPAFSSHDVDNGTLAMADQETIADQWDDYRLVVRLVPRQ